jgi:hypothetical protein
MASPEGLPALAAARLEWIPVYAGMTNEIAGMTKEILQ